VAVKIRVLTYHRIGLPRGPRSYESLTVPPRRFAAQLRLLRSLGFTLTRLDTVAAWLRDATPPPPRSAVLTFDDGFDDLYEHAFPLLVESRVPAVIYVITDRRNDAWRSIRPHGPLRLLDWSRIREIADHGIAIGSHTRTHPRLTQCSTDQLRSEIADSKKIIEDKLGREIRHFCYPFGDYDRRAIDAVRRAGYATACTTEKGVVRPTADPLRLPRLTVGKRMRLGRFLLRMTLRS